jgi:hypothetical protein
LYLEFSPATEREFAMVGRIIDEKARRSQNRYSLIEGG